MPSLTLRKIPLATHELKVQSNSGKRYLFSQGFNRLTNTKGWVPLDIKGFDPVPASMVVHDIMEHFVGDERGVHNEYQALGAAFWLRYEGGYFDGTIPAERFRPAFEMLFNHMHSHKLSTKSCPLVYEAHIALDHDTDYEIQRTIVTARDLIERMNLSGSSDAVIKSRSKLIRSLGHALGWMRIGHHRAALRYKGLRQNKLSTLYSKIQESLENIKDDDVTISLAIYPEKYDATLSIDRTITIKN